MVNWIPMKLVGRIGTGNRFTAKPVAMEPKNLFCLDLATNDSDGNKKKRLFINVKLII
jgi:hypothetical protein